MTASAAPTFFPAGSGRRSLSGKAFSRNDVTRAEEQLIMLRRISEIIAQTTDPRSGLRLMAKCIAEQVGSLACGIFVYR